MISMYDLKSINSKLTKRIIDMINLVIVIKLGARNISLNFYKVSPRFPKSIIDELGLADFSDLSSEKSIS